MEELRKWNENKLINPRTKRKIKLNGPVFKKIKKIYNKKYKDDDPINYKHFRINKIDPLLLENLPFNGMKNNDIFKFEYKWNPYSGVRLNEKDINGPLYFDPNALIHYFYTNRLNNLWINGYYQNEDFIQGHYGDALGKYPDFEIRGRGKHPEWYLFRLPIIDCYLENNNYSQAVTMGPILTDNEIKKIYRMSKRYKIYFQEMYGYKRPNLIKFKQIYDKAVDPLKDYNHLVENNNITIEELNLLKFNINIDSVKKLISFK